VERIAQREQMQRTQLWPYQEFVLEQNGRVVFDNVGMFTKSEKIHFIQVVFLFLWSNVGKTFDGHFPLGALSMGKREGMTLHSPPQAEGGLHTLNSGRSTLALHTLPYPL